MARSAFPARVAERIGQLNASPAPKPGPEKTETRDAATVTPAKRASSG
jgi:hypothetical protein